MNRTERINEAYEFIRSIGLVHSKKDVADKMMASPTSVISALRGNEGYLTDSFIGRFAATFPILSRAWLLTGEGCMKKNIPEHQQPFEDEYIKKLEKDVEFYKGKYEEILAKYFKLVEEVTLIKKQQSVADAV